MTIQSVYDAAFAPYGKVLEGYDTADLLQTLTAVTPIPDGVDYVPAQPELEALPIAEQLASNAYGGMPIQLGWCTTGTVSSTAALRTLFCSWPKRMTWWAAGWIPPR